LPEKLLEQVERIAKEKNTTVSALVREVLTDFVDFVDCEDDFELLRQRVDALEKEVFGKKKKKK